MSVNILWAVPASITDAPEYTKVRVFRGTNENDIDSYLQVDEIDRLDVNGNEITTYLDSSVDSGKDKFYFVRYFDPLASAMSRFFLTIFELTPKEQRYVDSLRAMLDPIVTSKFNEDGSFQQITDEELMLGIKLALSWFNTYPPVTFFKISDFPSGGNTAEGDQGYDMMVLYMAQIATLLNRFVGLSIRDFSYSDNGLSLEQRFSPAVQQAITQSMTLVNQMLSLAKLEFAFGGTAVGSIAMPIGIGGSISRGVGSILNVFASSGR